MSPFDWFLYDSNIDIQQVKHQFFEKVMGFIEGKLPLNLVLIVDSFIKTVLNVGKLINLEKTKCKVSQFSLDYSQFL